MRRASLRGAWSAGVDFDTGGLGAVAARLPGRRFVPGSPTIPPARCSPGLGFLRRHCCCLETRPGTCKVTWSAQAPARNPPDQTTPDRSHPRKAARYHNVDFSFESLTLPTRSTRRGADSRGPMSPASVRASLGVRKPKGRHAPHPLSVRSSSDHRLEYMSNSSGGGSMRQRVNSCIFSSM